MSRRPIDILCVGELLIDLITPNFAETLDEASTFERIPGGSPANLCMNMARLGNKCMLVASVGHDEMGVFLKRYVESTGVDTTYVYEVEEPTTLILVTRSKEVSNFQAYRMADKKISSRQFPHGRLDQISIFHTTCFALSAVPAQNTILDTAEKARRAGCMPSLDVNYAEKIWPQKLEAQRVVGEYCRLNPKIKISEVDWARLYGKMNSTDQVLDHFLKSGASEVCLTLGDAGLWIANDSERHFLPSRPVDVKDTTGAGDAFWSGYLTARLDGHGLMDSAIAGRRMAEMKLGFFGPLPKIMDKNQIYEFLV